MNGLMILIPVALLMGSLSLVAFLWSLRNGQYEDLDGASLRILLDEDPPADTDEEAPKGSGTGCAPSRPGARSAPSSRPLRRA